MGSKHPKITVVTVVYNAEHVIDKTIKSVLSQDYTNIEYIIIDGASTDATLKIISSYQDKLTIVSEPDKGVYDAMNKGIDMANGEWILFMNAGDHFYSPSAVSCAIASGYFSGYFSVIYGDAEFRLKNIAYIIEASDEVSTNQYMPFSHQAAFTKTDVARRSKFDLSYKIAADTAFFLRLVRDGHKMKHIPVTICSYNALEGLSADNEVKRCEEIVSLQAKLNGIDPKSEHFQQYIATAKRRQTIRKILPNFIWTLLRERSIKKRYEKNKIYKIG